MKFKPFGVICLRVCWFSAPPSRQHREGIMAKKAKKAKKAAKKKTA